MSNKQRKIVTLRIMMWPHKLETEKKTREGGREGDTDRRGERQNRGHVTWIWIFLWVRACECVKEEKQLKI